MKTLSLDLRERILASYDAGDGTRQEIADGYDVSLGMVKKLLSQRKRTGDVAPRMGIGARPRGSRRFAAMVRRLVWRWTGRSPARYFQIYVREALRPALQPSDIVILDNLASRKNPKALEPIEEMGAQVRFLPAYGPDLNPIEKTWSKVKQILRSKKARTEKSLLNAIAYSLKCVTSKDAKGWFKSCGYSYS